MNEKSTLSVARINPKQGTSNSYKSSFTRITSISFWNVPCCSFLVFLKASKQVTHFIKWTSEIVLKSKIYLNVKRRTKQVSSIWNNSINQVLWLFVYVSGYSIFSSNFVSVVCRSAHCAFFYVHSFHLFSREMHKINKWSR